jgi:hypothetical protein
MAGVRREFVASDRVATETPGIASGPLPPSYYDAKLRKHEPLAIGSIIALFVAVIVAWVMAE